MECHAAFARAGDLHIEGTPLYDAGSTGATGIRAPLVAGVADAGGKIMLLDADTAAGLHSRPPLPASSGGPLGAIAVSGDPQGFVVLRNAERMATPLALPVLQISASDATPLRQIAASGQTIELMVDHSSIESTASNVAADITVPGSDGLVVLMTSKSGWFNCAAERGGGIAIAMALATGVAALTGCTKDVRVLFTAGHELGHWGLLRYLEQHPQLRTQAGLWIHLGASIGARHCDVTRLFSRETEWRDWFVPALARHGAGPVTLMDAAHRPGGEAREVFERPFVSMAGHHRYFHSPQDLPDIAVDCASVARYGAAFRELFEKALRA